MIARELVRHGFCFPPAMGVPAVNIFTLGLLIALIATTSMSGCGDAAAGSGSGGAGSGTGGASTGGAGGGTGGSGSGGDGGAGPACESGLEQDSPECQACQDASCCITATIAADDPGTWTNSAATICREANCFAECGVEQPQCGGIVPSPASCADKLYENCCAETEACAKDDACVALIYICVDDRGCAPGTECFDACSTELGLEGGAPEWDAFLECFNGPWSCG